jgi:hypothetical protein
MKITNALKALIASFCVSIIVAVPTFAKRSIYLTGIVMDANNLKPLNAAKIFDENNHFLGTTNENGFFDLIVSTQDKGEIHFELKIKKDGYETFSQKEHWGDLSENMHASYYFGIKNKALPSGKSFGELVMTEKGQNYTEVLKAFESVNDKLNFEKRIELAKANNQKVWFEIATKYYIISSTGWIEIPSEDTKVLINNEKSILAKDLNSEIKRNSIKHMTTLSNSENKVALFTK